jgi:hypothetical protein
VFVRNLTTFLFSELECQHCVLQWKYVAGNNWGICSDGSGAVGCGEQEEFRACSDIAIGKGSASAIPTIKPPTKVKPSTDKWPTGDPNVHENEIDHHDHDHDGTSGNEEVQKPPASPSNMYGAIIAIFTFFLVLCALVAIYIYFYHGDLLKRMLRRQRISQQKTPLRSDSPVSSINSSPIEPPSRPPRTKRLSQTLKDIPHDSSSIMTSNEKSFSEV